MRHWLKKWTAWEYLPWWLANVPMYGFWLWFAARARHLAFFSNVNPDIPLGGALGESKHDILQLLPPEIVPKTFLVRGGETFENVVIALKNVGIDYPLIAKPDVGERGFLVKKISGPEGLKKHLERYPVDFIIQEFLTTPVEMTVLFHRFPDRNADSLSALASRRATDSLSALRSASTDSLSALRSASTDSLSALRSASTDSLSALRSASTDSLSALRSASTDRLSALRPRFGITSVCIKEFLAVRGDGVSSVRALMRENTRAMLQLERFGQEFPEVLEKIPAEGETFLLEPIGNHCRGTKFLNGNHLIDEDLLAAFEPVCARLPGVLYGRFDLKCESVDALRRGEFKVMELNGVFGEPAHVYDPSFGMWRAYRDFYRHWRLLFDLHGAQRQRGIHPTPHREAWRFIRQYFKYKKEMEAR